jgi:hypothetical protein
MTPAKVISPPWPRRFNTTWSGAQCNFGADGGNFSGDVAGADVRKRNRNIGWAGADEEVEAIECAGLNTDANFVGADYGSPGFGEFQDFGALLLHDYCFNYVRTQITSAK